MSSFGGSIWRTWSFLDMVITINHSGFNSGQSVRLNKFLKRVKKLFFWQSTFYRLWRCICTVRDDNVFCFNCQDHWVYLSLSSCSHLSDFTGCSVGQLYASARGLGIVSEHTMGVWWAGAVLPCCCSPRQNQLNTEIPSPVCPALAHSSVLSPPALQTVFKRSNVPSYQCSRPQHIA